MGFTYAVQVPVGKELQVKQMIVNTLDRLGNPGIVAIYALETFTQTLSEKGMSARQWKAKLPGYIFVTIENSSAGLGMEANCWQLIKQIPLVRNILNRYIQHNEWKDFFNHVDLEPEIQLAQTNSSDIELTEHVESKHYESPIVTLIENAKETIEEKMKEGKDQVIVTMKKTVTAVTAVKTVAIGRKTMYAIPYRLYKSLVNQHRQEGGDEAKPMSVQSALKGLKALLKAVLIC